MAQALLTAATALVGILLGAFLSRDTEYRRWLREERYKLSARLLDAAEEAYSKFASDQALAYVAQAVGDPDHDEDKMWGHLHQRATDTVDDLAAQLGLSVSDELRTRLVGIAQKEHEAQVHRALGSEPKTWLSQMSAVKHGVTAATEAVKLLAGHRVAAAAEELREATLALGHRENCDREAWDSASKRYDKARTILVEATRKEIAPKGTGNALHRW